MDWLDKKIDEALALEAARDREEQEAADREASRRNFIHQRRQEFLGDELAPSLQDLDARLRAREQPHHVEHTDLTGQEVVVKIHAGTGEAGLGRQRMAVKVTIPDPAAGSSCPRVQAYAGTDDGQWASRPFLDNETYQLNASEVTRAIIEEWIKTRKPADARSR